MNELAPLTALGPLPAGYRARPLTIGDAAAVTALMNAQERADTGEAVVEEADLLGDWARPSFDLERSTVAVLSAADLVAYAEVSGNGRGDAAVHPDHRGLGIGTVLADWMQRAAHAAGDEVIGMPVPLGSPGERLLRALGYEQRWTSWVLELPEGSAVQAQPLPAGHLLREVDGADEADLRAAWTVLEDAFLEWSVRPREPFEDFCARTTGRPDFAPWNLRAVQDPGGALVGVTVVQLASGCGYVDRIAVRRDRRGEGLARAMLADSFEVARAHGATRSQLSTDSRTGALGLYERVGMTVTSTWVNLAHPTHP